MQELQVKPVIGNSSLLGHNNRKQPIQYHLRLKQELEEMRRECTHLLKENFQLEQCIRYARRPASRYFGPTSRGTIHGLAHKYQQDSSLAYAGVLAETLDMCIAHPNRRSCNNQAN